MLNSAGFTPWIVLLDSSLPDRTAGTHASVLSQAAKKGFDYALVSHDVHVSDTLAHVRHAGLQLLLRLSVENEKFASEPPEGAGNPGENAENDDLPDPRYEGSRRAAPSASARPGDWDAAAATRCANELKLLLRKGTAGFCLNLDGPAPPDFFRRLLADVREEFPACVFLAWTIGIPAERVSALAGCGFDAAFSSSAWWDCRSSWLIDEVERLRPYGALIALASPVPVPARKQTRADRGRAERALWLAAATADGLMANAGFFTSNTDAAPATALAKLGELRKKKQAAASTGMTRWQVLSSPEAPVAALLVDANNDDEASRPWLMLFNLEDAPASIDAASLLARFGGLALVSEGAAGSNLEAVDQLTLEPLETRIVSIERTAPIKTAPGDPRRGSDGAARQAAKGPRIAIEHLSPCVDGGRFQVKRSLGERVVVEADIFGEGHDLLAAALRWRAADEDSWQEVAMLPVVNDRWRAELLLDRMGRFQYEIEAWIDVFGAYRDELGKKHAAGQDISLELQEGMLLLDAARQRAGHLDMPAAVATLKQLAAQIARQKNPALSVDLMLSEELHAVMKSTDARAFRVKSLPALELESERRAAAFSSWYECFPRSLSADAGSHGRLLDVLARLPAIRAMGFDTLYFPPIHPIGARHRKGRNNSLTAAEDDPGSPYAIGSPDGGHDAIHPELGTLEDFRTVVRAAAQHGLEVALDFAIQCSPDHPWLKEHPDWFSWRPDGTVRYAENPPKKYQDIVNVDFYAEGAVPKLWTALRNVVLFWVREGVRVFRVDNPHTKPMPFWEWLIGDVRARFPDVIFLAEAFTRPKPMYRLAKLGFSQSYTYFTWRHTKAEFTDYLTELSNGPPRDFFRPHFFVNTPDINPIFLQRSGRAGFVIRAALAATLSGLWGIYSGFELCESDPVPGKEEYLDSEKYQLRQRDWAQPGNIIAEIALLNRIRSSNPALQTHLGIEFCQSSGEQILCFTKVAGGNRLFVAICLDPHAAHECEVEFPLNHWGLDESSSWVFDDLVSRTRFTLQGRHHSLRLDPSKLPFCIWRVQTPERV